MQGPVIGRRAERGAERQVGQRRRCLPGTCVGEGGLCVQFCSAGASVLLLYLFDDRMVREGVKTYTTHNPIAASTFLYHVSRT